MTVEILMPKLGLTMEFGTVLRWLKAEGDLVTAGTPIAEFETEKTTATLEAPADGRLGRILVGEGEQVKVTTLLCHILAPDDAEPVPVAADGPRLTPAARQAVRELGLPLAEVTAAFGGGRVTREQVERWAAGRMAAPAAAAAAPVTAVTPVTAVSPVTGVTGVTGVTAVTAVTPVAGAERRPASAMRLTIARRMHQSLQEGAQLTLTSEVDVTALVQFRTALAPDFEDVYGLRPTYTDFLIKAMALAVPAVPQINSRWDGDAVTLFSGVNVGVAVALDEGLIVPVVQGCERLGLVALSRQIRDLAERARQGRLAPAELEGGTITLTNLGTEGIDAFTPILNPPQVAILGVGRIREVPVLQGDQWVPRAMITLSLTIDHRVVDGVPGARYLRRVADLLARPAILATG